MLKRKPSRGRGPRAPEAPDGATEQRILEAARRIFMRKGTAGARMQEIAAEAGVNQALLHYYFRSKDRLSAAVFAQFAQRIFPVLIQTLGSEMTIEQKIDTFVALYLDNLQKNPFLPAYLIAELHHHPERVEQLLASVAGGAPDVVMRPLFARLQAQIDERARAGEMRRIPAEQFIANLMSLCIFPFAARRMLGIVFAMDDAAFAAFIERRKAELPVFIRAALRP
jgi:TetR/AcrR family transcriptional regulator